MRQPRKPMGSPGGTGGQFDVMPGSGTSDLPNMSAAARAVAILNKRRRDARQAERKTENPQVTVEPKRKPEPKPTPKPEPKPIQEPESKPEPKPIPKPKPEEKPGVSTISFETPDGLKTTTFADGTRRQHERQDTGDTTPAVHPLLDQYRTLPPRDHFNGMTPQDVNPGYQKEMENLLNRAIKNHNPNLINAYNPWNCNCQRAVVAAELRMRGYDVNAVGSGRRMYDSQPVDIADMFQTKDRYQRRFSDKYASTATMSRTMLAKYPVGSRFFITGMQGHRKKVGHIWNAEIIADQTVPGGKRLVYYDMQKPLVQNIFDGTKYESYFHENFQYRQERSGSSDEDRTDAYSRDFRNVAYLRVDDMEPCDRILDGGIYGVPYCEPAGRKTQWTKSKLGHVNQDNDLWDTYRRNREYALRSVD